MDIQAQLSGHNAASARIGSLVNNEDVTFGVHSSALFLQDGEVTMVLEMS